MANNRLKISGIWRRYLLVDKKIFLVVFGNLIIIILSILESIIFGLLIDECLGKKDFSIFIAYFFSLAVCFIIGKTISYFVNYGTQAVHFRAAIFLNLDVIKHVQKLPLEYFKNTDFVYLSRRINQDADIVIGYVLEKIVSIAVAVVTLIIILGLVFYKSLIVGGLLFATVLVYVLIYNILNKKIYLTAYEQKEAQNLFFSNLTNLLANIKFAKINSITDYVNNAVYENIQSVIDFVIKYAKTTWTFTTGCDIVKYSFVLTYVYSAGIKVMKSGSGIGDFVVILNFLKCFFDNINEVLESSKVWKDTAASLNRLNELLAQKAESNGTVKLITINSISLENINFGYEKNKPLYSNFSYTFNKGNIYCIAGANGSGKSSLLMLLLGLYKPSSGHIRYNNIDVSAIDMETLRKDLISFSEQEPTLLKKSIRDNIYLTNENKIPIIAQKFIEYMNLNKKKLSINLDCIYDDQINSLSGGEKQKISHVRAFLKTPDVVILDEPTSALDNSSKNFFKHLILETFSDRITIIVTHDEDFLNIAHHIIRL